MRPSFAGCALLAAHQLDAVAVTAKVWGVERQQPALPVRKHGCNDGASEVTLAVFGEDDAPSLLGAYTLEGLGLAVDPASQRLVPTNLIMY